MKNGYFLVTSYQLVLYLYDNQLFCYKELFKTTKFKEGFKKLLMREMGWWQHFFLAKKNILHGICEFRKEVLIFQLNWLNVQRKNVIIDWEMSAVHWLEKCGQYKVDNYVLLCCESVVSVGGWEGGRIDITDTEVTQYKTEASQINTSHIIEAGGEKHQT